MLSKGKRFNLLRGGSRSGKTFIAVRANIIRALKYPRTRHLICRLHNTAVRGSIWRQTLPEVLRLSTDYKVKLNKSEMVVEFPHNGSEIWLAGLDDKERVEKILGQEFATISPEEVSQIPWSTIMVLRTRLAQTAPGLIQQMIFTCNPPPRSHWTYKIFKQGIDPASNDLLPDRDQYIEMRMNPKDNAENLAEAYIRDLENLPEQLRLRFLEGEWGADNPYALWQQSQIDGDRVPLLVPDARPQSQMEARKALMLIREIVRVVVSVDPPTTSGPEADECGITVQGMDRAGHGYVIDDCTVQGKSPAEWARVVADTFNFYEADLVVAEVNQGGEMVKETLRNAKHHLPFKAVTATRGKVIRAEPISAIYHDHMVHHFGTFPVLEQQMTDFTNDFDPRLMGYSPDRVDALVWGFTELFDLGAPIDLMSGVIEPDVPPPTAGWDL